MSQPTRPGRVVTLDLYVLHEVSQVVRALERNGGCTEEELALLVGAAYWERGRFSRVLTFMKYDGLICQDAAGELRLAR